MEAASRSCRISQMEKIPKEKSKQIIGLKEIVLGEGQKL
jgi:hypothetical protein